jgi:hypothetical protein
MKSLNVEVPDYAWVAIETRASQQMVSVRHIIMAALSLLRGSQPMTRRLAVCVDWERAKAERVTPQRTSLRGVVPCNLRESEPWPSPASCSRA